MAEEDVRVRIDATDNTAGATKGATDNVKKMAQESERALDSFKDRLRAVTTERERAFNGLGDQFRDLSKKLASAQVTGDGVGTAKLKQDYLSLTQTVVESQRSALQEMSKDRTLTDEQYIEVKRQQYGVEQELRNLDVAKHKAAEEQKLAETRRVEAEKTAEVKRAEQAKTAEVKRQAEARQQIEKTLQTVTTAGFVAGAALAGLVKISTDSISAFATQQRAMTGLTAISTAFGQSASVAKESAKALTSDGLLPLQSAVGGIRDLLTAGLGLEEATHLMQIFKDRAALGRAETVTFNQAVENLAQSFKTEQSMIGNLSGLTENYSQIVEVGARQLGKNVSALNDLERAQAKYLGIVALSNGYIGGAATVTDTLSGAQARLSTTSTQARAAIGEALAPVAKQWTELATLAAARITALSQSNQEMVRTTALVTGSMAAATVAIGATAGAVRMLGLAVGGGPWGAAIIAVTALGGALVGLQQAANATAEANRQQSKQVADLYGKYQDLQTTLKNTTTDTDEHKKAAADLYEVQQNLGKLLPEAVTKWDTHGRVLEINRDRFKELAEQAIKAKDAILGVSQSATDNVALTLSRLYGERQTVTAALEGARSDDLATRRKAIGTLFPEGGRAISTPGERAALEMAIARGEERLAGLESSIEKASAVARRETADITDIHDRTSRVKDGQATPPPQPPGLGSGGGGTEMSEALRAALEDLQDIQTLDKSPENLRKTLAKVKEILTTHQAELRKLNKDRDLIRLADIALPKEISQAEFAAATQALQIDEQMAQAKGEPLDPEVIKDRLQAIKSQFADYLKANPDAAAAIDVRLAGFDPEAIRQRVQQALEAIEGRKKLFGSTYSPEQERQDLAGVIPFAAVVPGRDGMKQVEDLLDRIRKLDAAIQAANFTRKFQGITDDWEAAQAGAAGKLADLEKQLTTESAKGDKSDPKAVASLKQQMLDMITPALKARQTALEAMLKTAGITAEQSIQIERELTQVKQSLYSQDVDAHRIATEARTANERRAATEIVKTQREISKALDKAAKEAAEAMKARHKSDEDAAEAKIRTKEKELQTLDRLIAAEERLKKITDAKQKIAELNQSGEREQVLLADGTFETRIHGMAEAKDRLAELEKDDADARARIVLQDEIANLRLRLESMRDSHRDREKVLADHFAAAKEILTTGFDSMNDAQGEKIGELAKSLQTDMGKLLKPWETYVLDVQRLLNSLGSETTPPQSSGTGATAPSRPAGTSAGFGGGAEMAMQSLGTGAYLPGGRPFAAMVNDVPETVLPDRYVPRLAAMVAREMLSLPNIPWTQGGGAGSLAITMSPGAVVVQVSGQANQAPGALGREVAGGVNDGMAAFVRGWSGGRISR